MAIPKIKFTGLFGTDLKAKDSDVKELKVDGDVTITNYDPRTGEKPKAYVKARVYQNSVFVEEGAKSDKTPDVADFTAKKAKALNDVANLDSSDGGLSKDDILKITQENKESYKKKWGLEDIAVDHNNRVLTLKWGENDILRIDFSSKANEVKPEELNQNNNESSKVHVVQSGDTLGSIAVSYGVSLKQLKDANKGINYDLLSLGQKIIIPSSSIKSESNPATSLSESQTTQTKQVDDTYSCPKGFQCIHTVTDKKGENTLSGIAKKYGIFLQQLINANPEVAKQKYLQPGDKLYVPQSIPIKGLYDLSQGGKNFLARLRERESRGHGEYKAENFAGYLGAYQMGKAALHDIGVYYEKSEAYVNNESNKEWKGIFKKNNKFGITSVEDFLNSPEKQDKAIIRYMQLTWLHIEQKGWKQYIGKTIAGIKVTELGLIAACHLVGRDKVETFLTSNGKIIPTDGNNPPQPLTVYLGDKGLMGKNEDFKLF